mmetsp:Transcript_24858/g.70767  ORF Transcript_24858/g.70767 Transcript_24858/m.70767 type:complete len:359 (+) Transcript_24858:135-1211(+)
MQPSPDPSTKRPLLEEEDSELALPPPGNPARGDLKSDRGGQDDENYSLLQLGASSGASGSSTSAAVFAKEGGVGSHRRPFEHEWQRTRESQGDAGAVELCQFSATAVRRPVDLQEGMEEDLPLAAGDDSPLSRSSNGGERHCFICLDGDKDSPLIRCCSTCYACTHTRCWREWRNSQRLTALRSRLLGLRMQSNNLLRCTICKSGTAVLAGEEGGLQWMNDLLCGVEGGRAVPLHQPQPHAGQDSDENDDVQLDDLVDMRTCLALMAYLGVLVLVLIIACVLIVTQRFYAGDVVLCCIIALYELSVLQVVALTVARRRSSMLASAASREERSNDQESPGGVDLEMQLQARDVPIPAHF